jgi:hypothetical protein
MSRWIHPIHGRGIHSPNLSDSRVGSKPLTDARILKYIREGKYGEELQEKYAAKRTKKQRKRDLVKEALRLLGL